MDAAVFFCPVSTAFFYNLIFLWGKIKKNLMRDNTKQNAYHSEYNNLVEKYETAKGGYDKASGEIADRQGQEEKIMCLPCMS